MFPRAWCGSRIGHRADIERDAVEGDRPRGGGRRGVGVLDVDASVFDIEVMDAPPDEECAGRACADATSM
ncbi:MAG: hypothetical protein U0Q12_03025 [Vicinamibacterales bacterium]